MHFFSILIPKFDRIRADLHRFQQNFMPLITKMRIKRLLGRHNYTADRICGNTAIIRTLQKLGIALTRQICYIMGVNRIPAKQVMMLYFEPQILYGITSPNKMRRCQAIQVRWKAEIARQLAPTLLKRRVYKMASHGGAGQSEEKQSLNRATVF